MEYEDNGQINFRQMVIRYTKAEFVCWYKYKYSKILI